MTYWPTYLFLRYKCKTHVHFFVLEYCNFSWHWLIFTWFVYSEATAMKFKRDFILACRIDCDTCWSWRWPTFSVFILTELYVLVYFCGKFPVERHWCLKDKSIFSMHHYLVTAVRMRLKVYTITKGFRRKCNIQDIVLLINSTFVLVLFSSILYETFNIDTIGMLVCLARGA